MRCRSLASPAGGVLMVMLALPCPVEGQANTTITGRALDLMLEVPVVSAQVHLIDEAARSARTVTTDAAGRFEFPLVSEGSYRLRAGSLGYLEVLTPILEVQRADTAYVIDVIVWMSPDAVPLAPLEVVASTRRAIRRPGLVAFLQRAERPGVGRFILRDDFPPTTRRVSDLLFNAGVSVRGDRSLVMSRLNCVPAVWIDGVRVLREEGALPLEAYEAVNILDPSQVEGIEVYATASQVPGDYGGRSARCGVIALWSRP